MILGSDAGGPGFKSHERQIFFQPVFLASVALKIMSNVASKEAVLLLRLLSRQQRPKKGWKKICLSWDLNPGPSASEPSIMTTTLPGSTYKSVSKSTIISCYHTLVTKVTSIRGWKRPKLRLCYCGGKNSACKCTVYSSEMPQKWICKCVLLEDKCLKDEVDKVVEVL